MKIVVVICFRYVPQNVLKEMRHCRMQTRVLWTNLCNTMPPRMPELSVQPWRKLQLSAQLAFRMRRLDIGYACHWVARLAAIQIVQYLQWAGNGNLVVVCARLLHEKRLSLSRIVSLGCVSFLFLQMLVLLIGVLFYYYYHYHHNTIPCKCKMRSLQNRPYSWKESRSLEVRLVGLSQMDQLLPYLMMAAIG